MGTFWEQSFPRSHLFIGKALKMASDELFQKVATRKLNGGWNITFEEDVATKS